MEKAYCSNGAYLLHQGASLRHVLAIDMSLSEQMQDAQESSSVSTARSNLSSSAQGIMQTSGTESGHLSPDATNLCCLLVALFVSSLPCAGLNCDISLKMQHTI